MFKFLPLFDIFFTELPPSVSKIEGNTKTLTEYNLDENDKMVKVRFPIS